GRDANEIELLHDVVRISRRREDAAEGGAQEEHIFLDLERRLHQPVLENWHARQALRAGQGSPSSGLRRRLMSSRIDAARSKSRFSAAWRISSCSRAICRSRSAWLRKRSVPSRTTEGVT